MKESEVIGVCDCSDGAEEGAVEAVGAWEDVCGGYCGCGGDATEETAVGEC